LVQSTSYNAPLSSVQAGTPCWTGLCAAGTAAAAVQADSTWWVVVTNRVSLTFLQPQQLQDFPFDTQTIEFALDLGPQQASDMAFVVAPGNRAGNIAANLLNVPAGIDGWTLNSASATASTVNYTSPGIRVSRITVSYSVTRIPAFFINRFVVPLCLLFVVAIAHNGGQNRMVGFMLFGSVVGFMFVAAAQTPQLPYMTRLDRFFQLCFFTAFIMVRAPV